MTLDDLYEVLPGTVCSTLTGNKALALRLKIEGYYGKLVERQQEEVLDIQRSDSLQLPIDLPYHK